MAGVSLMSGVLSKEKKARNLTQKKTISHKTKKTRLVVLTSKMKKKRALTTMKRPAGTLTRMMMMIKEISKRRIPLIRTRTQTLVLLTLLMMTTEVLERTALEMALAAKKRTTKNRPNLAADRTMMTRSLPLNLDQSEY